jgi:hypothetical protein
MFASIRRYSFESGSIDEHMRRADVSIAQDITDMPGCIGYQVLEVGDGEIISVTTFVDRASAEASVERVAEWMRGLPDDVDIRMTDALVAEVVINQARPELLERRNYADESAT